MPLRPPEFEIADTQNPLDSDLLDRKSRIEALTRVILGEEGPAVISVNGSFGTGKSAFLKMLAANLRLHRRIEVQEFDAWQQSHTGDPLVDVVSALTNGRDDRRGLLQIVGEFGWRVLKGVGAAAVSTASGGLIDPTAVEGTPAEQGEGDFVVWAHAEKAVSEFKDGLRDIIQKEAGSDEGPVKLVVIVDELDRCRPDYAIDMLNVVRHLLAVPGVVVVLGMNRKELEHRVKEVFGPETVADSYLRRFVDLPVDLGPLDELKLSSFSRRTLKSAGLSGDQHNGSLKTVLELMVTESGVSVRDFQQMVRRVAAIVDSPTVSGTAKQDPTTLEMAVAALLLLRQVDRPTYDAFTADRCDAFVAVAALRAELQEARDSGTEQVQRTLHRVEAQLLCMENQQGRSALALRDYEQKYVEAGLGNEEQANELREEGFRFPTYFVQPLADVIELFV